MLSGPSWAIVNRVSLILNSLNRLNEREGESTCNRVQRQKISTMDRTSSDPSPIHNATYSWLMMTSYRVSCFSTGAAALEAWRTAPPDAAIVDVGLPDIAGGDLVAMLLSAAHRPILALSQYHDEVVVSDLVSRGVMNYLVKPVSANQLVPPIQAMLSTSRRWDEEITRRTQVATAGSSSHHLEAVLEQFSFGVFIVDSNHRVVRSNQTANGMFESAEIPLRLDNGIIDANDPATALSLRQMIARGLRSEGTDSENAEVMSVSRLDGAAALQLWAAPLGERNDNIAFTPDGSVDAVIVVVVDPDAETPVPTNMLRSLFGLTGAESKLAAALVNGTSIEQYAKTVNVSYNTARSHLKSIFVKTRTHRQVDLVILLSKLLGNVSSKGN